MKGVLKGLLIGGMVAAIGVAVLIVGLYLNDWKFTAFGSEDYTMETYTETQSNTNLKLDLDAVKFNVEFYDGDKVTVDYPVSKSYNVKIFEESNTLTVKRWRKWYRFISWHGTDTLPEAKIKLPKDGVYNVEIEVNAGTTTLADGTYGNLSVDLNAGAFVAGNINCNFFECEVNAGKAELQIIDCAAAKTEVNAGTLNVNALKSDSLNLKINAGNADIKSVDALRTKIDVNAGTAYLSFNGIKSDYSVTVDKSAGKCNLSQQIATTGNKTITVDINAGTVNAIFSDEV